MGKRGQFRGRYSVAVEFPGGLRWWSETMKTESRTPEELIADLREAAQFIEDTNARRHGLISILSEAVKTVGIEAKK